MIKLKSKLTGEISTVTQEAFEQIVTQGSLNYYTILERVEIVPVPKSVQKEIEKGGHK